MASVSFTFLRKLISWRRKKSCEEGEEMSVQSSKVENTLMDIQKILVWDDPFFSCCCLISVNIVFWLIVYLDFKFYGIIFTTLLILACEQLWMEHFSVYFNKNNSNAQNVIPCSSSTSYQRLFNFESNDFFKKIFIMLSDIYVKAKIYKQSQPGMFCILVSLGFLLIGIIGRSLSDIKAFYILLMLIMTVPGALVRVLPPEVFQNITNLIHCTQKETSEYEEVEPYLPDTSEEALELLRLAGDLQLPSKEDDEESNDLLLEHISNRTNDTSESACSKISFFPDSVVMPSPDNSMDFWESDSNFWEKTESHEFPKNDINFQSKHFDGDSSEEEFVKGLNISEETTPKNKKNVLENDPDNVVSTDKSLLTTHMQSKTYTSNDRESSSDTDSFEMISDADM